MQCKQKFSCNASRSFFNYNYLFKGYGQYRHNSNLYKNVYDNKQSLHIINAH